MKIIIIGSIAAGVSAAARLAAAQRGAQITVYEKGGFYSCGTGGLPHYLCEDQPEAAAAGRACCRYRRAEPEGIYRAVWCTAADAEPAVLL